jgi:hypothetical protein
MAQENPDSGRVFDAAKAIVETLQGLDKTHQERAIRFATESLGLSPSAEAQAPVMTGHSEALPPPSPLDAKRHASDIKQFTTAKAPKSDQQFAAVVAYFYRFEAPESQRRESIGAEDLTEAARLAGRSRPSKPLQTLNNAKQSGYLDSIERGRFQISTVGENLVAVTLPGTEAFGGVANRENTRGRPRTKRTRQRAKVPIVKRR